MKWFHQPKSDHAWSDWLVTEKGHLVDHISIPERCHKIGHYLIQQRHCLRCGFTDIDIVERFISADRVQEHYQLLPDKQAVVPKHDKVS